MSEGVRLGRARNAGIQDRRSLLFMNYIHARLFKRSLLVLSVKVAFTLLLPWIRRHEDFYRFTRILYPVHFYRLTSKGPHFYPTPTLCGLDRASAVVGFSGDFRSV